MVDNTAQQHTARRTYDYASSSPMGSDPVPTPGPARLRPHVTRPDNFSAFFPSASFSWASTLFVPSVRWAGEGAPRCQEPALRRPRGICSQATALGDASDCRFHSGPSARRALSLASWREGGGGGVKVWSWRGPFRHRAQLSVLRTPAWTDKKYIPSYLTSHAGPCSPACTALQFTSGALNAPCEPVSNQPNPPVQLLADPRPISGATAFPPAAPVLSHLPLRPGPYRPPPCPPHPVHTTERYEIHAGRQADRWWTLLVSESH